MFSEKRMSGIILFMIVLALSIVAAKKKFIHVVDQTVCNQCGDCIKTCKENAIIVNIVDGKKSHEIDAAKCTQCGDCIDGCKEGAILALSPKKAEAFLLKAK